MIPKCIDLILTAYPSLREEDVVRIGRIAKAAA